MSTLAGTTRATPEITNDHTNESLQKRFVERFKDASILQKIAVVGAPLAAAAIGFSVLHTGSEATAQPEYSFSADIAGDQKQTVEIANGMTAENLVAGIYAEEHLEGMSGPETLEGPALVQAAEYVNKQGQPGKVTSDGTQTYNLMPGQTVDVPVITPDQAQHSFELNNQAFKN